MSYDVYVGPKRSLGEPFQASPTYNVAQMFRAEHDTAAARCLDDVAATVGGKGTHYAHAGDPGVRHGPPTRRASEPDRLDRPAPTVATTEEKGTRAHGNPPDFNGGPDRASDAARLAVGRRRLTVEECAVLQDFPVGHPFHGTKTSRYRQVGNAVPPKLAEVIARAILTPTEAP